jgi:hypothetical protein
MQLSLPGSRQELLQKKVSWFLWFLWSDTWLVLGKLCSAWRCVMQFLPGTGKWHLRSTLISERTVLTSPFPDVLLSVILCYFFSIYGEKLQVFGNKTWDVCITVNVRLSGNSSIGKVAVAAYFHGAHYNSPVALAAYFHRAHYNSPMALAAHFHRAHYNSPMASAAHFCRYPASRGISRAVPKISECEYNYSI